MKPHTPRENFVLGISRSGFHRLNYVEWGEPDNPRLILCVHGLTRNCRDFDVLAQNLAVNYRVVCPDMPGRGKSDWLEEKSEYTYSTYIADLAVLLGRLAVDRIDWLGTSMGGLIGMFIAAMPNTPIKRLIVNDIGPLIEEQALTRISHYAGSDPRFETQKQLEDYLRFIHAQFGALSDAQWAHLAQHSSRPQSGGGYRLHYDPGIAEAFKSAPAGDVDLWDTWKKVQCPVLILRGLDSDLLSAGTVEEMLKRGPECQLIEFANVGHAPPLMSADQIAAIRNWLDGGQRR